MESLWSFCRMECWHLNRHEPNYSIEQSQDDEEPETLSFSAVLEISERENDARSTTSKASSWALKFSRLEIFFTCDKTWKFPLVTKHKLSSRFVIQSKFILCRHSIELMLKTSHIWCKPTVILNTHYFQMSICLCDENFSNFIITQSRSLGDFPWHCRVNSCHN